MEDEISGGKQSICSSGENYGRISSGKLTPEAQNAKPNLSVSDDGGHPQQQDDAADVRKRGEAADARKRDEAVDVMKGILVLQMVLCHCIQFFCDDANLAVHILRDYINLTTFSGFFFAFGVTSWYAYFRRPFRASIRRMLRTAVRLLFAFWISSICYVGLKELRYFDPRQIGLILSFHKYAGWSEFLASFFGVMVIGIVLFAVFQRINWLTVVILCAVSAATTFLPRSAVTSPLAALFVGSTQYTTFPVISYLFYFAFGVWICKNQWKWKPWLFGMAAAAFLPEFYYYLRHCSLTDRFPPDLWFLAGGALAVYLYFLLSQKIRLRFLQEVGANSLFYLLVTNIVIFAFAGSKYKVYSIRYAVIFYLLLISGTWYLQTLVRNVSYKKQV